jgi:hypothetical protein
VIRKQKTLPWSQMMSVLEAAFKGSRQFKHLSNDSVHCHSRHRRSSSTSHDEDFQECDELKPASFISGAHYAFM